MASSPETHRKLKQAATRVAGYLTIFVLGSLLLMVILGDAFFGIPSALGMRNWLANPGGVFADCSDPAYRLRNKFCNKRYTRTEESWKDLSNSGDNFIPF